VTPAIVDIFAHTRERLLDIGSPIEREAAEILAELPEGSVPGVFVLSHQPDDEEGPDNAKARDEEEGQVGMRHTKNEAAQPKRVARKDSVRVSEKEVV
jgi:hypothetical protein